MSGGVVIRQWVIGIVACAVASVLAITPGNAEFRVCNRSGENIDVAIAYDAGKAGFAIEGWYSIRNGRCSTIFGRRLHNRYFYLYAEGSNGTDWDGDDDDRGYSFCITRRAFRHFDRRFGDNSDDACERHKMESKRFFEVDVGDSARWTQTLDPGPDAPDSDPAPAAPAPAPAPAPSGTPSTPAPRGSACERYPNLC